MLDYHANMIVIGYQGSIIQATGQCAEVIAFSDEVYVLENVPNVDDFITYDRPYSITTYLMVANNTIHVPFMINNLIPTFTMNNPGLIVNEIAKIHAEVSAKEHRSIYDANLDVRIPISFTDTFSYFKTSSLKNYEMENCHEYDVIYLSPNLESWNPTNPEWDDQDMEYIERQGEVKPRPRDHLNNSTLSDPM